MIYRPDSGKRLSHQNLAKFALCRKILRRQDNYPPRWFKRRVGQKSPLVSEDWQADFQWKIDALLMLWPSEKGRFQAFWATYYHQFQNRGTTFFMQTKARKRPAFRHLRTFSRWQGQNGSNARHAVLEAMLKFLSRSDFSPFLGICCQPRRWCLKNWCFFDDMLNSAPDFWCSWWWIWIPRFELWWELRSDKGCRVADRQCTKFASH